MKVSFQFRINTDIYGTCKQCIQISATWGHQNIRRQSELVDNINALHFVPLVYFYPKVMNGGCFFIGLQRVCRHENTHETPSLQ